MGLNSEILLKVKTRPDRFIFEIETTGALKPEEVFRFSFRILAAKLKEI